MEAKMKRFYPTQAIQHYSELDLAKLEEQGITMIVSDLDNTLVADGEITVSPQLADWLAALRAKRIKIIIVSNNKSEKRVKDFAEPLGLEYYYKARKPNPQIYHHIFSKHQQLPQQTLMLGDRLTTDIYGGNKMGMRTVLVEPIDPAEPLGIRMMRVLERVLRIGMR
ncbi:MAG: YqeG family HAD IIIA-type phosphatase [Culicoidibacterales bacterium]